MFVSAIHIIMLISYQIYLISMIFFYSYMNVFEEQDLKIEKDFFSSNPNLGQFHNRVITGALFPPPQDDTNLIKVCVSLSQYLIA